MPNKGQLISFFIILVVIAGAMWQVISHGESLKQSKNLIQPAFIAQQPQPEPSDNDDLSIIDNNSETALVLIDDGSSDPKKFMLEVQESTTAFDLLQEASLTAGFAIESEEYDFGVLIEAINNKRNGQDDKYWLFYVNDELSQLTSDKVLVNFDDKIEFIFISR